MESSTYATPPTPALGFKPALSGAFDLVGCASTNFMLTKPQAGAELVFLVLGGIYEMQTGSPGIQDDNGTFALKTNGSLLVSNKLCLRIF